MVFNMNDKPILSFDTLLLSNNNTVCLNISIALNFLAYVAIYKQKYKVLGLAKFFNNIILLADNI